MNLIDYKKELLLWICVVIASMGAVIIQTNIWEGVALLLIAGFLFVGRGFYKKYLK